MKNRELMVGDRVTFKNGLIKIIESTSNIKMYDPNMILKIERPKYEVIEEKKELLTQEEKEFLHGILKYYEINPVVFNIDDMEFYDKDDYMVVACLDYPSNLTFEGVKKNRRYTLKELGLE